MKEHAAQSKYVTNAEVAAAREIKRRRLSSDPWIQITRLFVRVTDHFYFGECSLSSSFMLLSFAGSFTGNHLKDSLGLSPFA